MLFPKTFLLTIVDFETISMEESTMSVAIEKIPIITLLLTFHQTMHNMLKDLNKLCDFTEEQAEVDTHIELLKITENC